MNFKRRCVGQRWNLRSKGSSRSLISIFCVFADNLPPESGKGAGEWLKCSRPFRQGRFDSYGVSFGLVIMARPPGRRSHLGKL